jgi:glutaredoxin
MWLKDREYDFTEYNISTHPQYADDLVRMGYRVTPVTVIDKETMVVGFNPQKLSTALE